MDLAEGRSHDIEFETLCGDNKLKGRMSQRYFVYTKLTINPNMFLPTFCVIAFVGLAAAKDIETSRSKRQLGVYYVCGSNPNNYVSQYPCSNSVSNCGGSNCNYGYNIIPSSFYNSNSYCNSGCNNLNCNSYNGQYINGQYVAYAVGSNQYSPCASSCCSSNSRTFYGPQNNGMNVVSVSNGLYNPYNTFSNNMGAMPFSTNGFQNGYNPYAVNNFNNGVNTNMGNGGNQGTYNPYDPSTNGALGGQGTYNPYDAKFSRLAARGPTCGGTELATAYCMNGQCANGLHCVSGNLCCNCQVGASGGKCNVNTDCAVGYTCTQNGNCCAQNGYQGLKLEACAEDRSCPSKFTCGPGSLCYPSSS
ncbi:unnamed protein product [Auanema sp. JU1783]|nr:unnamed protein product [Auanema sp. JU1783]